MVLTGPSSLPRAPSSTRPAVFLFFPMKEQEMGISNPFFKTEKQPDRPVGVERRPPLWLISGSPPTIYVWVWVFFFLEKYSII